MLEEKAENIFAPKVKWKAWLQKWMPASSQASLYFGKAAEIPQLLVDSSIGWLLMLERAILMHLQLAAVMIEIQVQWASEHIIMNIKHRAK